MKEVQQNDTVKVHYTGKLSNGEVFDTSENREPLEFKVGSGMLIPGFENGVLGMKENETKTITIPASEAYGEVHPELVHEIDKKHLPPEIEPKVGMDLVSTAPDGTEMILRIKEVKDSTIVVDANHPLAGKDLTFDITVVEIK
ncbi:MAG: peptidylprolyl isomerase [Bacteroidetes bacterium]|nr:MAG: peptidylprolyl isomerase [Bacteroidota bacterium]